jgi:hypothetical protein
MEDDIMKDENTGVRQGVLESKPMEATVADLKDGRSTAPKRAPPGPIEHVILPQAPRIRTGFSDDFERPGAVNRA